MKEWKEGKEMEGRKEGRHVSEEDITGSNFMITALQLVCCNE